MPKKFDFLSPGVLLREIDLSVLPSEQEEEGPIIIGRTRQGPAMKPIKVRNLEDFVTIFGKPVPGGTTLSGDVWRSGNTAGPTYAAYAAQAWLAAQESPVTMVRLLGAQHNGASSSGYAGWNTTNSANAAIGSNGGAYGLFIANAPEGTARVGGVLAAVFYVDSGALILSGTLGGGSPVAAGPGFLIKSENTNAWVMEIRDSAGALVDKKAFNFNRNDANYIRNVFNTNPQLVHSTLVTDSQRKTYWLGESFEQHVAAHITGSGAGQMWGCIAALEEKTGDTDDNWAYHKYGMQTAYSGWTFCQASSGSYSTFDALDQQKLFRCVALHEGEEIQKNVGIAIEDLKLPVNPTVDNYSSFTLKVLDIWSGAALEEYKQLNLNPASPNYIARRIGDMTQTWNETDRRYRMEGDHPNVSDYIRIEMDSDVDAGGPADTTWLPFGFYGPPRPKGFTVFSGSAGTFYDYVGPKAANLGPLDHALASYSNPFVKGSGSAEYLVYDAAWDNTGTGRAVVKAPGHSGFIANQTAYTASFKYPSIPLRKSGSDGFTPNPYKCYWGIRPVITASSTTKDPDYVDYVRRFGGVNYPIDPGTSNASYEYSFVFTLDDIVVDETLNSAYYVSGSHQAKASADNWGWAYSAKSGSAKLLDKGIKQYVMPLFGGHDGVDIKEKEPFGNHKLTDSDSNTTNYVYYSLNRAIDSVADSEVAPCNLMVVPGVNKPAITNKLLNIAQGRKDALAIIDLEGDYTPRTESTESADTRRGSVQTTVDNMKNRNLNTSYGCAFFPWVQITDNLNNSERVWVPSSVAALGAFAQSQANSEIWFAPAGFNRGGLGNLGGAQGPRVVQARQRLDVSERDDLYEANINPIATFPNEGVVIFGQKTLQITPSALDRINVRRLMIYLKSKVGHIARNLLFDQNVASTWARFTGQVEPLLAEVQSRFGITEYKLILDETTTTPDLIDRNIMYAKIYLKPARAIEFIVVDFIITRTGADFA